MVKYITIHGYHQAIPKELKDICFGSMLNEDNYKRFTKAGWSDEQFRNARMQDYFSLDAAEAFVSIYTSKKKE